MASPFPSCSSALMSLVKGAWFCLFLVLLCQTGFACAGVCLSVCAGEQLICRQASCFTPLLLASPAQVPLNGDLGTAEHCQQPE